MSRINSSLSGSSQNYFPTRVDSSAIRGNMIITESNDGLLYRTNLTTSEVIGNALQGHEHFVCSLIKSADGMLIASVSCEKTVKRWYAGTGDAFGSPLQGRSESVECVGISSDGMFVVSSSSDNTVERWRASTGEAIGEPFRGGIDQFVDVEIN